MMPEHDRIDLQRANDGEEPSAGERLGARSRRGTKPAERLEHEEPPLVAAAPDRCAQCGAPLCLRKQVINLALGNTDRMNCLVCLGQEGGQLPDEVLSGIKAYVLSRDCFRKEWERYHGVEYCPDPQGCFPDRCFGL